METFRATYGIDDGYIGKARYHHFEIYDGDIEDDFTDEDLEKLYSSAMQDAFECSVYPYPSTGDLETFILWAKEQIEKRDSSEED